MELLPRLTPYRRVEVLMRATVPILILAATTPFGHFATSPDLPVNRSFLAFTIPEKDLLPESVAYDPVEEAFYVGSTRKGKIVKVGRDGKVTDFVAPRRHGLWMVIGMKVDARRRILWAASSAGSNLEGRMDSGDRSRRTRLLPRSRLPMAWLDLRWRAPRPTPAPYTRRTRRERKVGVAGGRGRGFVQGKARPHSRRCDGSRRVPLLCEQQSRLRRQGAGPGRSGR